MCDNFINRARLPNPMATPILSCPLTQQVLVGRGTCIRVYMYVVNFKLLRFERSFENSFLYLYSELLSKYEGAPSYSPFPGNPIPRASIPAEMQRLFLP